MALAGWDRDERLVRGRRGLAELKIEQTGESRLGALNEAGTERRLLVETMSAESLEEADVENKGMILTHVIMWVHVCQKPRSCWGSGRSNIVVN